MGGKMKENGVGDRKKTGQRSFCLLVQGGKFSLEENFLLYRGIDRGVGHKIHNIKTVRLRANSGS
jgi:hypothetical protein